MKNLDTGYHIPYGFKKNKKAKGTLTIEEITKKVRQVDINNASGKIVGFLGGVPVRANSKVPEGEIWIYSEVEFERVFTEGRKFDYGKNKTSKR